MDRSKIVAIITGVISLVLAIAYLVLVQLLDFRGDMQPAPISLTPASGTLSTIVTSTNATRQINPALAAFVN